MRASEESENLAKVLILRHQDVNQVQKIDQGKKVYIKHYFRFQQRVNALRNLFDQSQKLKQRKFFRKMHMVICKTQLITKAQKQINKCSKYIRFIQWRDSIRLMKKSKHEEEKRNRQRQEELKKIEKKLTKIQIEREELLQRLKELDHLEGELKLQKSNLGSTEQPAQTIQLIQPKEAIQPVETIKPTETSQNASPIEPAQLIEPAQPVQEPQTVQQPQPSVRFNLDPQAPTKQSQQLNKNDEQQPLSGRKSVFKQNYCAPNQPVKKDGSKSPSTKKARHSVFVQSVLEKRQQIGVSSNLSSSRINEESSSDEDRKPQNEKPSVITIKKTESDVVQPRSVTSYYQPPKVQENTRPHNQTLGSDELPSSFKIVTPDPQQKKPQFVPTNGQPLIIEEAGKSVTEIVQTNRQQNEKVGLNELPPTVDSRIDISEYDQSFLKLVQAADYEEVFHGMIPNKAKWGKNLKFQDLFVYSHKTLNESLTNIKGMIYTRTFVDNIEERADGQRRSTLKRGSVVTAPQPKIKQTDEKINDKHAQQLINLAENNALDANKIILKYTGDYSTHKSQSELVSQLLQLLIEDNVDPYFKRSSANAKVVTLWQLVFIEEVYLQIAKQLVKNMKGDEKVQNYLKLFVILATYIPIGRKIFYPMLNFLMRLIPQQQNADNQRQMKLIFNRLVRENLKYVDNQLYQKVIPNEFYEEYQEQTYFPRFIRNSLPSLYELGLITIAKQVHVQIYLLNGAQVDIYAESSTTVRQSVQQALCVLGLKHLLHRGDQQQLEGQVDSDYFGLVEHALRENGEKYERFLEDSERILDVVTKWSGVQINAPSGYDNSKKYEDESFQNTIHCPKKLFLTIRIFFQWNENDLAAQSLFFIQTFSQVMEGKIRLREDDYMNLAALKLCTETQRVKMDDLHKIQLHYYIPIHIVKKTSSITQPQMIDIIRERYKKLQENSSQVAVCAYIEYLKTHPLFFSVQFEGVYTYEIKQFQSGSKERLVVALSHNVISLCNEFTRQIKRKIHIDKIIKWGNTDTEFALLDECNIKFSFDTEQAPFMAFIFSKYYKQGIIDNFKPK